jgi:hypothetical protein
LLVDAWQVRWHWADFIIQLAQLRRYDIEFSFQKLNEVSLVSAVVIRTVIQVLSLELVLSVTPVLDALVEVEIPIEEVIPVVYQ